ncbi:MAG: palindromic element RPE2 domain-containing protein [Rickettsia endosymbiont of Culicoides impunctatus]|nr:MAG: palindromic element RPE2 domain-containing protein [Rickettsia endosymbiont of Culicoides impunctatus]
MVNSGEFGARSDGATPISNRRALSDNVTNFSSIDYNRLVKFCLYYGTNIGSDGGRVDYLLHNPSS